jgi:hypothetical protein
MKHGTWILGWDSTFFWHEREIDSRIVSLFDDDRSRVSRGFASSKAPETVAFAQFENPFTEPTVNRAFNRE